MKVLLASLAAILAPCAGGQSSSPGSAAAGTMDLDPDDSTWP
jgi:hypothetical protein